MEVKIKTLIQRKSNQEDLQRLIFRRPDVPDTTMWKVQGACNCVSFRESSDFFLRDGRTNKG